MIFFFGRELKILSFNEKKCKWYFFCMELKVLSSIEKNANDIFFGIEIRVLTLNEKKCKQYLFCYRLINFRESNEHFVRICIFCKML